MKIKTVSILGALIAIALFFFYINKGNKPISYGGIKGRFINNTFLRKNSDTIPGGVPFYCTEINFISADSAGISDGFEDYKLAYKYDGNKYLLLKATFKGNMPFSFNRDSTITLVDSAWTCISTGSEFKKVTEAGEKIKNFNYFLNEQMIAGNYLIYKANRPSRQNVVFSADGLVTGLENFHTYTICYSGDCVGETLLPSYIISFKSNNDCITDYAVKIDKKNKTLGIYIIGTPIKDIIGERAIENRIFDLRQ